MSDKERKLLNTLQDVACGHCSAEAGAQLILSDFAAHCPEKELGHGTEPAESFRDWLIHGGAGHEDGEAGIRACTLPLSEAIDMVEQYLEYRAEVKSGKYPIARPELPETVSSTEKLVTCKGQPVPHIRIHACREPIVECNLVACRNPLHYQTDGSPSAHEIGPSCMAEALPDKCPTCGSWPHGIRSFFGSACPDSWHSSVATQKEKP